ncbi:MULTISPECIES: AraC family transcriptional regulator [unclassified Ruegeria]|uniref:helix-turn-helix domain-containing protein n=1 Tax=unclassified Ruegeria TaxID=2625375 RepID=UPI001491FD59|nr:MULTISPECIES: AraC family transcriptional regulator [unclassified Ruegeria]NOD74983.1 helix-turn-helix domain-containing protein [Ruegeria sp. HKCCD4332]NOD86944.1 helix-turn-helix domain-containing protein [Ruegeria sp. HKCCD4318]NOE12499.1 helix-turn-helix domain-containing protein [Ruegeria sp. HKCCD4318-2]NOG09336.1 helix-turn-helix domain-containing protein [Ruegeria sp. HKCCD4315]
MDVDVGRLHFFVQALDRYSGNANMSRAVLGQTGLKPQDIAPPVETCSIQKEALFIRYACDATKDITFAARTGLEVTSASTVTAYISKYSRDLKQVMENLSRFHGIIDPAIALSLRVAGNFAALEADWKDAGFARYHRRTEFLIFAALARMRNLTQINLQPIEIRFHHKVGDQAKSFEKIAGFPVIFGSEKMEIVLPLSALELPVPTYDPKLREHLLEYGERLLAECEKPNRSIRARTEGMITKSLPGTIPQAEAIASELGMSLRTFSRRLKEEGTSYRDIVDDLRCDLAQTFLNNRMSLSEISFSLGYADQAAFSTAFKRWTGQPPSAFKTRVEHPIRT